VEAAKAAHVKVISYDRLVLNSDIDLFISFDRVAIGTMQAEYLVKRAPKGNYVLIAGSPNDEGAKTLYDAQRKVLKPYLDRGEIKLISESYTKDWLPSEAYSPCSKQSIPAKEISPPCLLPTMAWRAARSGFAGTWSRWQSFCLGARRDLAAVISIAQGEQSMTVYKPVTNQALMAAEEAVRLAKGGTPAANATVNNGKINVPTILLQSILVTKDNIKSTVVRDGFQKLQSINQALSPAQQIK